MHGHDADRVVATCPAPPAFPPDVAAALQRPRARVTVRYTLPAAYTRPRAHDVMLMSTPYEAVLAVLMLDTKQTVRFVRTGSAAEGRARRALPDRPRAARRRTRTGHSRSPGMPATLSVERPPHGLTPSRRAAAVRCSEVRRVDAEHRPQPVGARRGDRAARGRPAAARPTRARAARPAARRRARRRGAGGARSSPGRSRVSARRPRAGRADVDAERARAAPGRAARASPARARPPRTSASQTRDAEPPREVVVAGARGPLRGEPVGGAQGADLLLAGAAA